MSTSPTTPTAPSPPPPPQSKKEGDNDEKATTTKQSSTTSSPSPQQHDEEPDVCCICLDELPTDTNKLTRAACCGKQLHAECQHNVMNSKMRDDLKYRCHQCRKPIPETDKEHIKQLREWLDKGEAWSQNMMACWYREGKFGVKQSYVMAAMLYEKAVAQGDPDSMCDLAILYQDGNGVVQSFEKTVELYTMAVEQGHAGATLNFAHMYLAGQGVSQSFEKAAELYTLAAEQGNVGAMFNLGVLYFHGDGVGQSKELAREWWTKAAQEGYEDAINNLKVLDQQEGKSTTTAPTTTASPTTTDKAKGYIMAAKHGNVEAMFNLGVRYFQGQGVAQSNELAREWWAKAANEGHKHAIECLKLLDAGEGRSTTTASSIQAPPLPICCSSCNKPQPSGHTFRKCKGCRTVQYCNKECQRAHWSPGGHKQECK